MKFSIFHQAGFLALVALASAACSGGTLDDTSDFTTGGTGSGTGGTTAGTGGTTAGTGGATASYCDAPTQVMQSTCDGPACHGAPGKPGVFYTDFFNPPAGQTVGQMLLDKPADYEIVVNMDTCPKADPEKLIDSSAPDNSLILKKVLGMQACGQQMPDASGLPADQVACLTEWVRGVVADGPAN